MEAEIDEAVRNSFADMQDRFVRFDGEAFFHHYPDYTVLTLAGGPGRYRSLFLNKTATEILEMCDGSTTVTTIADSFRRRHRAPAARVEHSVTDLISAGTSGHFLRLERTPAQAGLSVLGSEEYFVPQKLSLELTSRCNHKCLHCYGDFTPTRSAYIALPRLKDILSQLVAAGTKVLTITGGEPFLYPDILPLLEWVYPQMEAVGLISNATRIPEAACALMADHADKTVFQTSINGRPAYHDFFTGSPGAYERTIKAIRRMVRDGVRLRLSMNVNSDNFDDIQAVADLADELGVFTMSVSIAHNIGREKTRRSDDAFYSGRNRDNNVDMINRVAAEVSTIKQRHPGLFKKSLDFKGVMSIGQSSPSAESDPNEKPYTCGAGMRSIHVTAEGDVNLCAIAASCGFPRLGSLMDQTLEEVMTSPMARKVATMSAPVPAVCDTQCEHFAFCGGCLARGYAKFKDVQEDCVWGNRFLVNGNNHDDEFDA